MNKDKATLLAEYLHDVFRLAIKSAPEDKVLEILNQLRYDPECICEPTQPSTSHLDQNDKYVAVVNQALIKTFTTEGRSNFYFRKLARTIMENPK